MATMIRHALSRQLTAGKGEAIPDRGLDTRDDFRDNSSLIRAFALLRDAHDASPTTTNIPGVSAMRTAEDQGTRLVPLTISKRLS